MCQVLKDATLWTQTPTILCLAFLVCKFLRNIVEYFWKKNKQGPLQRVSFITHKTRTCMWGAVRWFNV